MPNETKPISGCAPAFFLPVDQALSRILSERKCPVIKDKPWIAGGVTRVLEAVASGRDFLQSVAGDFAGPWARSSYFDALKSARRLDLVREINEVVSRGIMTAALPDRLAGIPGLEQFDVYAGDGHWHEHATHDPKRRRKLRGEAAGSQAHAATGHVFGLNLRTRALFHLAHCDEKTKLKEHDMGVLKRLGKDILRQGAPKGRKVLWIWDPAGISYRQWYNWKQSAGIYFLSRAKENMILDHVAGQSWDASDPVNAGIESDGFLTEGPSTMIRLVVYRDPATGELYKFITNLLTLPPGLIAQLYRMRWDIEKSFDSFKNKLMEAKAWGTTAEAKTAQANFMALALNLVTLFEHLIERDHGIHNEPEDKRRAKRRLEEIRQAHKAGKQIPALHLALTRATQTSVKFIRWLRCHLWKETSWDAALTRLRRSYASL